MNSFFDEYITPTLKRSIKVKKVLYSKITKYQQIDVIDTYDFGKVLFLDKRFQTSEKEEYFYHESLIHPAFMMHPSPKNVLLIGGGDGGSLEEICKYKEVESIDMIELDEEVVWVAQTYLKSICKDAFEDPRVKLFFQDGRSFLEKTDKKYDVIVLDLTDPLEPSKFLYTKEFYELCKSKLKPKGILTLHNDTPFFFPEAFNVITKTLKAVFSKVKQFVTYIIGYGFDFAFSLCFEDLLEPTHEQLIQRFEKRKIKDLLFYSPKNHQTLFNLPPYINKILEIPCRISTDDSPYCIE